MFEAQIRQPLVEGNKTIADVSNDICRPIENKPTKLWWLGFTISFAFLMLMVLSLGWTTWEGIGTWGVNKTVMWG